MEVQPRTPTTKGPAEWFTGDVWIDAIAQAHGPSPVSIASAHFAPDAPPPGQPLGRPDAVCDRGGGARAVPRRVGRHDPPRRRRPHIWGEWHWHGGAPDRFMTHLAMSEGDAEWGEHVSNGEYDGQG